MNTPKGFFRCIGIGCPVSPHGWSHLHPLTTAPAEWGLLFLSGEVHVIEPEPAPAMVA
jgi:hypothetical protein